MVLWAASEEEGNGGGGGILHRYNIIMFGNVYSLIILQVHCDWSLENT